MGIKISNKLNLKCLPRRMNFHLSFSCNPVFFPFLFNVFRFFCSVFFRSPPLTINLLSLVFLVDFYSFSFFFDWMCSYFYFIFCPILRMLLCISVFLLLILFLQLFPISITFFPLFLSSSLFNIFRSLNSCFSPFSFLSVLRFLFLTISLALLFPMPFLESGLFFSLLTFYPSPFFIFLFFTSIILIFSHFFLFFFSLFFTVRLSDFSYRSYIFIC